MGYVGKEQGVIQPHLKVKVSESKSVLKALVPKPRRKLCERNNTANRFNVWIMGAIALLVWNENKRAKV